MVVVLVTVRSGCASTRSFAHCGNVLVVEVVVVRVVVVRDVVVVVVAETCVVVSEVVSDVIVASVMVVTVSVLGARVTVIVTVVASALVVMFALVCTSSDPSDVVGARVIVTVVDSKVACGDAIEAVPLIGTLGDCDETVPALAALSASITLPAQRVPLREERLTSSSVKESS
jgi:hypothetical protein